MGAGGSVDAAEAAKNASDEDIQKALDNMPEEKKAKAVAALAAKKAGPKAEKKASGDQTVAIIYYSMYGHIEGMAQEIKKGLEKGGVSVDMFQVPETLPDDALSKMGAPPKNAEVPTLDFEMVSKLNEYDGVLPQSLSDKFFCGRGILIVIYVKMSLKFELLFCRSQLNS